MMKIVSNTIHWPWQHSPFDIYDVVAGSVVSIDDTSAARFTATEVAEVLVEETSGNQFDGSAAFVLRLADGRVAGFSLAYGNTYGNDFTDGGVVYVGREVDAVLERIGRPRIKRRR